MGSTDTACEEQGAGAVLDRLANRVEIAVANTAGILQTGIPRAGFGTLDLRGRAAVGSKQRGTAAASRETREQSDRQCQLHGGLAWRGQLRQSMFHGRFPVNQLLGRREYAMPQRSKVNSKWHERNHSRDMSPVAKIVAALRYGLRPARAFSRLQRSKRMSCESMTKLQACHAFFLNDFTPRRLTRRVRERTATSHRRTCRRPSGGPHRNGVGRIRQFTERFAARRVPAPAPATRARRTSQYRYRIHRNFY